MTKAEILKEVNKAIGPLGVQEAIDFVDELIEDLEMTVDALEHDLERENS